MCALCVLNSARVMPTHSVHTARVLRRHVRMLAYLNSAFRMPVHMRTHVRTHVCTFSLQPPLRPSGPAESPSRFIFFFLHFMITTLVFKIFLPK